jgi:hypothetical protein
MIQHRTPPTLRDTLLEKLLAVDLKVPRRQPMIEVPA